MFRTEQNLELYFSKEIINGDLLIFGCRIVVVFEDGEETLVEECDLLVFLNIPDDHHSFLELLQDLVPVTLLFLNYHQVIETLPIKSFFLSDDNTKNEDYCEEVNVEIVSDVRHSVVHCDS